MPDRVASIAGLVDDGVAAYRDRDYSKGIRLLFEAIDQDPRHWRAKLYLAMCYYQSGEIFTAVHHFGFLKNNCPDVDVRQRAEAALAALSSQMQSKMPEMTCTMKKPVCATSASATSDVAQDEDYAADLEWQDNSR